MFKKMVSVLAAVGLMLSLCGCDLFTADTAELLSPPSLSGDLKHISQAIKQSAGEGYTLKYPSRGSYRSAVVQQDVNNDGKNEAFAFYSTTDGDVVTMHINVVHKVGEEWISAGEQRIVAGGVDKIEFCDLDADGVLEILVGWTVYGESEKQLSIYSFTQNTLTQRLLQKYTQFITCNLDSDQNNEVLIVDFNATEIKNNALLYTLRDGKAVQLSSCQLDSKVQSVGEPMLAQLSSGNPAIYIDSIKGVGAITEVLILDKGQLLNPLFDIELQETSKTLRSSSYSVADINGDGILEIPVQENVPAVLATERTEKLYLTKWCSFNGENLTNQLTTMINVLDRYYYILPEKWVGNIAILKDTDKSIREIYSYDAENLTVGESLLYLRAFSKKDWQSGKYDKLGLSEVAADDENVFVCKISKTAKDKGLNLEKVKSNFVIYKEE